MPGRGRQVWEPPWRGQEEWESRLWGHRRLSPGLCFRGGGPCGSLWASLSSAVHPVALAVQTLLGSACPVLWLVCVGGDQALRL